MTEDFIGKGTYLGITHADYLSGDFGPEGGALSASGAKTILNKSPMHYAYERHHPKPPTEAMEVGTVVHTLVLGEGVGFEIVRPGRDKTAEPCKNYQTKAAQEARDAIRAEGSVPLLAKDAGPIKAMAEAVLAHPIARPLLERESHVEASMYAQDPDSCVWLKARPDSMSCDGKQDCILDIKKLESAKKEKVNKTARDYGYDLSNWVYPYVHSLVYSGDEPRFVFIVVEATQPHPVQVYVMDDEYRRGAELRMRKAIEKYAECVESGRWPGYSDEIETLEAPFYYFADSQEMSAAA